MNNLIIKQLSNIIINNPVVRSKVLAETISKILKNVPELVSYISDSNENEFNQDKIFSEIGKYLLYKNYKKGDFIQHAYDTDNKFIISLEGNYAKIDIKYNRIYLTSKEYLSHLIKLRLLNENILYANCLAKNKKVFPLNDNVEILNLKNITKYLKITNYDDLIKSIKLKIEQSPWEINTSQNIDDFLKLYNPEFSDQKINYLDSEPKYPAYLPYYIFDKAVKSTTLIGQLNKPKNIKNLSAFVCLDNCEIFYIDKSNISNNSKLFDYFNEKISEIVSTNLFDKHFLFKSCDKYFLINNYSKYFQKIKINKGDFIIQQDRLHEGVFFIIDGLLELESYRSFNELGELNFNLLHSLDNFPNTFSKTQENINKFIGSINLKKDDNLEQITKSNIFITRANQKKIIPLITYKYPDIIGLCEIYDYKTGINKYSVKCLSDEANIFFAPSEIMRSMLTEESINRSIGHIISENRKLIKDSINKYKINFIRSVQLEIKNNNKIILTNKLKFQKNVSYIKNFSICRSNDNYKFNTLNPAVTNFMKSSNKNGKINILETFNGNRVFNENNNLSSTQKNNENNLLNYFLKSKIKQNNFNNILRLAHKSENISLSKTAYNQKMYLNNCSNTNLNNANNIPNIKMNPNKSIKKKLFKVYSNIFDENDYNINNNLRNSYQVGNVSIPIICHKNNKYDDIMNYTFRANNINPSLFHFINNKTEFKLSNIKKNNKEIKIFNGNKLNEGSYPLSSSMKGFGNTQRHNSYIKRNFYNAI